MTNLAIINSETTLQNTCKLLGDLFTKSKYLQVRISKGKRTLDQNSLAAVWYKQIGDALGQTPEEVKAECKYHYGCPILASDDKRSRYVEMVKLLITERWAQQTMKENKSVNEIGVEVVMDWPVTSLMTVEQMKEFMETIQRVYAGEGIILESNRKGVV